MNEDLKPCYDIESDWEWLGSAKEPTKQVWKHKSRQHIWRIIDFEKETVTFRDTLYVKPEGIIDIYRPLTNIEKGRIRPFILDIMHEIRPISMPYMPVSYKVYVEYHNKKALGILYFMDVDEDKSIVPIKRFFEVEPGSSFLSYEEISWNAFREIAEVEDGQNTIKD